jgi:hypothetical protein
MKTGNRVTGSLLLTYLLPSEFVFFGPPLGVLIPSSDLSLKRMIKENWLSFFLRESFNLGKTGSRQLKKQQCTHTAI